MTVPLYGLGPKPAQDEIIRSPLGREQLVALAREAGLTEVAQVYIERLERFAALIAAHAKQEYIDSVYEQHRETMFSNKDLGMLVDAVKAEREACAEVCEEVADDYRGLQYDFCGNNLAEVCAADIRSRSSEH